MPGAAAAPRAPSGGGQGGVRARQVEKGSEGKKEREHKWNGGKKGATEQSVKDKKAVERWR